MAIRFGWDTPSCIVTAEEVPKNRPRDGDTSSLLGHDMDELFASRLCPMCSRALERRPACVVGRARFPPDHPDERGAGASPHRSTQCPEPDNSLHGLTRSPAASHYHLTTYPHPPSSPLPQPQPPPHPVSPPPSIFPSTSIFNVFLFFSIPSSILPITLLCASKLNS
ncbi:hypothetical protein SAICODRAFT_31692 [Saitoella complicata NRRL Y-17804]|uniref:uncharacterized protein n=1 Tax=Saitoella complicata (strain BCRC 22490 / CBS 7301 / JCM 7358 / NBRC 10748 / NRRL Y-17804) TaxID=698492 RepID=UPI0008674EC7|nr:uncharacterized protein SAICODRAFT_31692 [Saitoella complicata NRRL Y-17804]ODQ50625.1 hypothetical protein SAICODRAFT_31692 [Saitoella complicata NRRL Y-17804]